MFIIIVFIYIGNLLMVLKHLKWASMVKFEYKSWLQNIWNKLDLWNYSYESYMEVKLDKTITKFVYV